jgi:hypothetical protein
MGEIKGGRKRIMKGQVVIETVKEINCLGAILDRSGKLDK